MVCGVFNIGNFQGLIQGESATHLMFPNYSHYICVIKVHLLYSQNFLWIFNSLLKYLMFNINKHMGLIGISQRNLKYKIDFYSKHKNYSFPKFNRSQTISIKINMGETRVHNRES